MKILAPGLPPSLVTQPWGRGSSRLEGSAHLGSEQRNLSTFPAALDPWVWSAFLASPQQLTVLAVSGDHSEMDRVEGAARGTGLSAVGPSQASSVPSPSRAGQRPCSLGLFLCPGPCPGLCGPHRVRQAPAPLLTPWCP